MWVYYDVRTMFNFFMKFCPVVPEICHGLVHGPRKERKKEENNNNNNNKKWSKNNKSPNVVWET
jgi:hypothetical protein